MREIDFIKQSKALELMNRPFLLGVSGGSGSGKTFFSQALVKELATSHGQKVCEIIYQDDFYFDQSQKFDHDGGAVNFDHPDSIDFKLLAQCLTSLKNGQAADVPTYDFATHTRKSQTKTVSPHPVIIVDGILIFHSHVVRELFDDLVFFETPEELRFKRRLERDVKERGRTPDGVYQQFHNQVKPMHDLYVEPSKHHAQHIIKDDGHFENILKKYCAILGKS